MKDLGGHTSSEMLAVDKNREWAHWPRMRWRSVSARHFLHASIEIICCPSRRARAELEEASTRVNAKGVAVLCGTLYVRHCVRASACYLAGGWVRHGCTCHSLSCCMYCESTSACTVNPHPLPWMCNMHMHTHTCTQSRTRACTRARTHQTHLRRPVYATPAWTQTPTWRLRHRLWPVSLLMALLRWRSVGRGAGWALSLHACFGW